MNEKSIFENVDYRKMVRDHVDRIEQGKRGGWQKLAQHLGALPVTVSQIFSGQRDLSAEQALETANYFGWSELETDYFITLTDLSRAGTHKLKERIKRKLTALRAQAENLKSRALQSYQLSEEAKAIFYSNWYYSALSLATALPGQHTARSLADRLDIAPQTAAHALQFLVENGFCKQEGTHFLIGPTFTHLENTSPHVQRHHTQWRLQAIQKMQHVDSEKELFYTAPIVLSHSDVIEIRRMLVQLIDQVLKKVAPSPNQDLVCLNIDWFRI